MENNPTTEIYEYLKKMAASIVEKDPLELNSMKDELKEYAQSISSQMPQESRELMNREFEKCRHSAQEWFSVYKDLHFDPATKEDILKEDVIEFFFSMNKKVVAVQKNFFLLAMIEQQLSANLPLSEEQRTAKIAKLRIITLAKEQGLTPSYKDQNTTAPADSNMQRLWYFGDERNFLQSSDEGLNDEQALDYLLD